MRPILVGLAVAVFIGVLFFGDDLNGAINNIRMDEFKIDLKPSVSFRALFD